jgi:hypothetical protein
LDEQRASPRLGRKLANRMSRLLASRQTAVRRSSGVGAWKLPEGSAA